MRIIGTLLLGIGLLTGEGERANAQAPACTGRNILHELETSDPPAHARILAAAAATENANAILWKIEQGGKPPSYLFGTVHVTDERVNALSPRIKDALGGARRVLLEIDDFSPARLMGLLLRSRQLVMFTDGRRLDQLLGPDEFAKVREILGRSGVPSPVAGLFKPWVATMLLALSDCEKGRMGQGLLPLDARLARDARHKEVDVVGLETLESQLQAMASVPEPDQVEMLKASLRYYDRIDDVLETVTQLYLQRRLGAIWPLQLALAEKVGVAPKIFDSAEQNLLVKRNRVMRDKAVAHLAEGSVFIAVGALHLPGQDGLVALFREAGYSVTAVE